MSQTAHPQHSGPQAEAAARRRRLVVVAVAAVALLVAGGVVAFLLTRDGSPTAGPTVTAAVPTPTVEPVAREATGGLAAVLPGTVLQYALSSSSAGQAWVDAGALEAWDDVYDDGSGARVLVSSAQFATVEEAVAFAQGLLAALPTPVDATPTGGATDGATDGATEPATTGPVLPVSGDVTAGGATVGSYTITPVDQGQAVAVWTNTTSVFRLQGPATEIVNLFSAFPM